MRSDWTRTCLLPPLLVLLCWAPGASAQDVIEPADVSLDDVGPDAGSPVCGAEEKRARRAARAAGTRLEREVKAVAKAMVAEGDLVAASHWEQRDERWFAEHRDKGRRALKALVPGDAGAPTVELCRVLATRDASGCAGLDATRDRQACGAWVALAAALQADEPRCASLKPALKDACELMVQPPRTACEEGPGETICRAALDALSAAESACGDPPELHRCVWSLWTRFLRDGVEACAGPRPRTVAMCRAVASRDPGACPGKAQGKEPAQRPVHAYVSAEVSPHALEPRLIVSLQTDGPAVCGVALEARREGEVITTHSSVHTLDSWAPRELRIALADDTRLEGLEVGSSAVCVIRPRW